MLQIIPKWSIQIQKTFEGELELRHKRVYLLIKNGEETELCLSEADFLELQDFFKKGTRDE